MSKAEVLEAKERELGRPLESRTRILGEQALNLLSEMMTLAFVGTKRQQEDQLVKKLL